jgi:molybdate transport system substrate-binding protein
MSQSNEEKPMHLSRAKPVEQSGRCASVKPFTVIVSLVLMAGLVGCGGSDRNSAPASITVFAAASLKNTFTEIAQRFKTENAGASVEFSFAGSSDLVTQLINGASADVFASADTKNMAKAADAGLLAGNSVNFASNTLVIATAPRNPKEIGSFADLNRPGLSVVICAPQVPCGAATQRVEDATGIHLDPVSEESSVTDVLNKVTAGQADAGLVYVTDARGVGEKVTAVPFAEAARATNTYPIASMKKSANANLAHKFVDLVTGEAGQKILAQAGFAKP